MFSIANDCMLNTLKKKAGGKRFDLEELALDGTCILMNRIKNGTRKVEDWRVEYLATCCHFIALKLLYNDQQKWEDKVVSLDEYYETHPWVEFHDHNLQD